jgi:hypothetical protein
MAMGLPGPLIMGQGWEQARQPVSGSQAAQTAAAAPPGAEIAVAVPPRNGCSARPGPDPAAAQPGRG